MDTFAQQVRARRKSLGLSLDKLSSKVGCSTAYLSLVENGKANPSCSRIVKIAAGLEMSPGALFPSVTNQDQNNVVIRREKRLSFGFSGSDTNIELLISPNVKKQMDARIAVISPGGSSNGDYRHPGEEFGFVLKGTFQLVIDGMVYNLAEGDSFFFHSIRTHSFKNNSNEKAVVLWVNYPPFLF